MDQRPYEKRARPRVQRRAGGSGEKVALYTQHFSRRQIVFGSFTLSSSSSFSPPPRQQQSPPTPQTETTRWRRRNARKEIRKCE